MTQYVFHSDPGHAWLEVKKSELEALGVDQEISECSYQYGLTVYLEEDCDAPAFLAAKGRAFERFSFEDRHVDGDSFIRSYMPYKPPSLQEDIMPPFLDKLNKQLKGLEIVAVTYDGENFPVISLNDGSGLWIQSDDERNGPGVAVHVTTDEDGNQTELGTWQMR